ncbi:MAG: hypothetical protein H0W62_00060 [Chitinophagales bacterium]|nr:hypothetical protein [Chitinophagales bacterium]
MQLLAKLYFLSVILFIGFHTNAQVTSNFIDTTLNAKLLYLGYALQLPAGDMSDRFGANNNIGAGINFKLGNNWLLGAEFNFIFGGRVKEDSILNKLLTSTGGIVGTNGNYETIFLSERGYSLMGKFGKIVPVFHSNPNSGISLMIGAGFLQHKIKFEDPNHQVPEVDDDYAKGYDRLTNGFAISQSLGYIHLDKRKLVNFSISAEALEGFTQNRRDWNFDQMQKDNSKRLDVLIGLKLAWLIPFYGKNEERIYTY